MSQHDPRHTEASVANFLDNGIVRAGTVVSIVLFTIAASYQAGRYFEETARNFSLINEKLTAIDTKREQNTNDRWRRSDMVRFCRETELLNPGWTCGKLD